MFLRIVDLEPIIQNCYKRSQACLSMALKNKKSNFSEWYTEVIQSAELADYTNVSGAMVLRPNSYSIWESIQNYLNSRFKRDGVRNAYFPMFIPEKLLKKESKHIEGFAPEVAWVTHAGKSKLKEKLAVRPTSETIMYDSYSKWIRSWKDLPLRLNQWVNVVRWEFKHPTPFLRTREFLWQEGHSVFATKEEADKEVFKMSRIYRDTYEKLMAVPVLEGLKSDKEKFAGAEYSISLETLMPDGKAIQACTSHHLGQNFSKPFKISFLDKNEKRAFGWQNSWGFTTRSLGVMIAIHGDDKGLVLPPRVAPNKVVIIPILFKGKEGPVLKAANALKKSLNKYGAILDDREGYSAGRKFNDWEIRGIPLRIEIGPRDVQNKSVVVARRDTSEKVTVKVSKLDSTVLSMLKSMHSDMFDRAKKNLVNSIVDVNSVLELNKVVSSGKIARAYWCGSISSEDEIKRKTGAKSLNSEFRARVNGKSCFVTGGEAKYSTYFGRSY